MAKNIKTAYVMAALAMGLIGATTTARADSGDGEYHFTFTAGSVNQSVGYFDLNGAIANNFSGTTTINGFTGNILPTSFGNLGNGSGSIFEFDAYISGELSTSYYMGNLNHIGNTYEGNNGYQLVASLVGNSPGGSHSPSSGGAPSPEVNTLVGFLVVAGTMVFVKRRRDTKAEAEAATA